MKDAAHHLKHVQRKVIQFARKAENQASAATQMTKTSTSVALEEFPATPRQRRRSLRAGR